MSYPKETKKVPHLLLLDFGTLFVKATAVTGYSKFHDYNTIIRNQVYYISPEKAKRVRLETKGETDIEPGHFTLQEIEDRKLLFQADPVYVQLDAIPTSVDILVKAYQNVCEQVEQELQIKKGEIVNHYEDWGVVVAIANFETSEVGKEVEEMHVEAASRVGFNSIYVNNQIMFDFVSQLHWMKEQGLPEGYALIINIGGGDTEVAAISGVPLAHSFRRFALAGQDVTLYCQNILREQHNFPGVLFTTIEDWLMELGTVNNDAEPTTKIYKRKEIDIQQLLNAPAILFDYRKYWLKDRRFNSITEIIKESIETVVMSSSFDTQVALILQAVIIVGGAAHFRGIAQRLEAELRAEFPEYMNDIHVYVGSEPQMSGINGMRQLITMKYKGEGLTFTILN